MTKLHGDKQPIKNSSSVSLKSMLTQVVGSMFKEGFEFEIKIGEAI